MVMYIGRLNSVGNNNYCYFKQVKLGIVNNCNGDNVIRRQEQADSHGEVSKVRRHYDDVMFSGVVDTEQLTVSNIYRCEICGATVYESKYDVVNTINKTSRLQHLRRVHQQLPINCNGCGHSLNSLHQIVLGQIKFWERNNYG